MKGAAAGQMNQPRDAVSTAAGEFLVVDYLNDRAIADVERAGDAAIAGGNGVVSFGERAGGVEAGLSAAIQGKWPGKDVGAFGEGYGAGGDRGVVRSLLHCRGDGYRVGRGTDLHGDINTVRSGDLNQDVLLDEFTEAGDLNSDRISSGINAVEQVQTCISGLAH